MGRPRPTRHRAGVETGHRRHRGGTLAHRVSRPLAIGLGLAILAAAAALLSQAFSRDAKTRVRASGIIEMDEIDVSSLIGGRVTQLLVGEGDAVAVGDTLAVLDRDELEAQYRAQQAEAERAAALALEVQRGPRAEQIRMARAEVAAAAAQLQLADKELARIQELFRNGVAAQAELDRAHAARDQASARTRAAREQLRLLESGSRREDIAASQKAAESARASAAAAVSRLRELVLIAPISGVVLLKNFERGELALAGQPIVTLGNPDSLWMRVYVPATEIGRVRLGAPVEVRLTGFGNRPFHGRVVEIATRSEFTPRVALTEEERSNIVFGVKVVLDPSEGVLKAGLPADVVIHAPRTGDR
jgi:HlyD family secretion protein